MKENGVLHRDAQKKAQILNQQFSSVFTVDDEEDEVSIIEKRGLSSLSPLWVKNVVIICRLDDVFKGSKTVILRCGMYIRP